jgi:hypothetical protein
MTTIAPSGRPRIRLALALLLAVGLFGCSKEPEQQPAVTTTPGAGPGDHGDAGRDREARGCCG